METYKYIIDLCNNYDENNRLTPKHRASIISYYNELHRKIHIERQSCAWNRCGDRSLFLCIGTGKGFEMYGGGDYYWYLGGFNW